MWEEGVAWLTIVRADGQPQSVPEWFLWDGEAFPIQSRQGRQKLKNIICNPRVGLNLNSSETGGDVVCVEGTAELDESAPPAHEVEAYVKKYREGITRIGFDVGDFAQAYTFAVRVTPTRRQVW